MMLTLFHTLVALHILGGATAALAFWVPVAGRKGGARHRFWGRVFVLAMLGTGTLAVLMSGLTLSAPLVTHPHLAGRFDAPFIRGIFGWMMLSMGILTINLAWYGWQCVRRKADRASQRTPLNLGLQAAVIAGALNCALQGWLIGQWLMVGISVIGVATGVTNLWFLYRPHPARFDWLNEHIKGLVGAGISVYTAFLAFGSVRLLPSLALNPLMWCIPLSIGLGLILWHQRQVARRGAALLAAAAGRVVPAAPAVPEPAARGLAH
jgi:uncharacterized membrane protein YidH (DUF202 family)